MREMTPDETRRGGRGAFATIVVLVILAVVIGLILLLVLRPGAPPVALASPTQTKLSMISVPRDTVDVPLPDGTVWQEKLNGLYQAKGIDVMREAFDRMLGVKIDYTIVIDMDDFAS